MKKFNVKTIVYTALLAALTCISTMVITIPSPMGGYVNLGDCFVLLSGWLLGPFYGAFAAGIGSMLADILAGYAHYAPGTLIIKAAMAVLAGIVFSACRKHGGLSYLIRAVGGIAAEMLMVFGYFAYASLILGKGLAAAASIPGNIVQGICGIISSVLIMELLSRNRQMARLIGVSDIREEIKR